ncbi:MAG: RpnC/YadD family protein, partial [Isosphaeraceae bacterium]
HVEIESRDSVAAFRPRMFDYYVQLRRDTGLPVLPIALLLRVGQGGNTWDSYDEFFGEHHVIRFRYASVGLPGLKAEDYATGENLLGVALSALMEQPAASERKVELYAEALKRIAVSGENDIRRYLLAECLEAYGQLDESEGDRVRALLQGEGYREVEPLMKTTYERGIEAGIVQGIERGIELGERRLTVELLEDRFGPLSPAARQRVEAMSREELARLRHESLRADDLGQVGLGD